jgi:hypothetical protein
MQTIHGCAVDTERARHVGDGFAGGDPVWKAAKKAATTSQKVARRRPFALG